MTNTVVNDSPPKVKSELSFKKIDSLLTHKGIHSRELLLSKRWQVLSDCCKNKPVWIVYYLLNNNNVLTLTTDKQNTILEIELSYNTGNSDKNMKQDIYCLRWLNPTFLEKIRSTYIELNVDISTWVEGRNYVDIDEKTMVESMLRALC